MLFDTHSHVNFGVFSKDADEVIKRALDSGVWLINVGADLETSKKAVELAEKYSKKYSGGVYAAIGLHPNDFTKGFDYEVYKNLATNLKVVAIGETGLDYYRIKDEETRNKDGQKELFEKHISLAMELNKPLIIHCREALSTSSGQAHDDIIQILNTKYKILNTRAGILHSFSGNLEQAKQYIGLGFKIAFNGIITFSRDYDEVVREIPLENILIETDCPYLTPVPYRGQRNEPAYVIEVAKKLAEIKGLNLEEVAEKTTKNAKEVFGV